MSTCLSDFIKTKYNINFSLNPIDLNYEKPNSINVKFRTNE